MAYSAKDFIKNPTSLKASVIWNVLWTAVIMVIMVSLFVISMVNKVDAQPRGNVFQVCMDIETATTNLRDDYGETIQMILPNEMPPNVGGQMILTANIETGTWTLLVIGPDYPELMCMIQNGNSYSPNRFQTIPPGENFKSGDDT